MNHYYDKVKEYLLEAGCTIKHENEGEGLFVVDYENMGISNLVIGCADPILIVEQFIFEINEECVEVFKSLLQKNREMIAGAFVIDDSGEKVLYRNTLMLENLDLNELEGTFNALGLMLSEYSEDLIRFASK